jgi:membrane-bound lytic murein transglycosylase MltF
MRWLGVLVALGVAAVPVVGPGEAFAADPVKPPATAAPPPSPGSDSPGAGTTYSRPRQLVIANKPWTGDLDKMLERRMIRVLVPYSRTLYYSDKGHERGITAELIRSWERDLNRRYAKQLGKRPLTVYIIPTTRDKLISGLAEGHGDISAGNITVTEERRQVVDFLTPADLKPVDEIVVAGPRAPLIKSVDDLSGQTVHVRKATSYHASLVSLNERFVKEGKPPAKLVLLPDALEDEDKLEMVNAGLLDLVIVDDWIASIWVHILPNVKVIPEAAVRVDGRTGWAIRKDSPKLQAAITSYYTGVAQKQGLVNYLKAQAVRRVKQIKNNTADAELKRFEEVLTFFRKYGERYNFDPVMLAAQGYQESQLNQNAKSHVGAIGVMQIMPATGDQLKVGDIRITEPNIHAGAKYLDQLMTKYFPDAKFSESDRPLFAFASYNAGPGNISRMRKLAGQRGLNPDKWFNNVEIVTAEKIGIETTTYVRNIYKYYVAYKLILEQVELREKLKAQIKKGG